MKRKRRKPKPEAETSYICPTCGEQIVIPVDPSQGTAQEYGEDCPVCCNPNIIHVEFDPAWEQPRVWADAE